MARISSVGVRICGLTAALALVTSAAVVGLVQPAQAHNYVVSSTPSEGQTLTALPESFIVTTNDVLLPDGAAAIEVTDAAGLYYGDGCAVIDGPSVAMVAALGEPGAYSMAWQAVSADGHTISGSIPFTWQPADGAELSSGATAAPVCGETAVEPSAETGAPEESAPASPGIADEGDGDSAGEAAQADTALPWIVGGVIVVVIAAGAILLVTRRRDRS